MASTDASPAALSLLLRAPSKDAVAALFDALFKLRHHSEAERAARALALPLGLGADDAGALAAAANALLRRALYESSELQSLEAVRALLPAGLDGRLTALVAGVRCSGGAALRARARARAEPLFFLAPLPNAPPFSLPAQVLFAGLPAWREAAVEQRVGLPRLEGVSWRVLAMNSNAAVANANEAALRLKLSLRDQPAQEGVMPPQRDLFVAVSPASLGAMLEGMRRIKEQLGAFS